MEKIEKFLKSGRYNYEFIFTGHCLASSFAILSAFDLSSSNIFEKTENKTRIFTFDENKLITGNFTNLRNMTLSF